MDYMNEMKGLLHAIERAPTAKDVQDEAQKVLDAAQKYSRKEEITRLQEEIKRLIAESKIELQERIPTTSCDHHPLLLACRRGDVDIFNIVLDTYAKLGIDVDINQRFEISHDGVAVKSTTVLAETLRSNNYENEDKRDALVRSLVERGADVNAECWYREKYFDGTYSNKSADICWWHASRTLQDFMLKHGLDIEMKTENGYNFLMSCIEAPDSQTCSELLELGANPNQCDALFKAVTCFFDVPSQYKANEDNDESIENDRAELKKIMSLLLSHGADLTPICEIILTNECTELDELFGLTNERKIKEEVV